MAIQELHDKIVIGGTLVTEGDGTDLLDNWPDVGEMNFRLADKLIGRLDLSCDSGYVVRTYEFAFPEVREVTYSNSLDDGNFDITAFIGPRAVSLDMVLRNTPGINGSGTPLHSEAQMRDDIMRFLSPLRRPILLFSEHGDYIEEIGGIRRRRVRFFRLRGADSPVNVARPQFNELSASWVAMEGVMKSVDLHQAVITFGETDLAAEYIITTNNKGTYPAWWRLTVDGDMEDVQIQLGNQRLWLNYHVEEPAAVTIDSRTKSVTIGGKPVGYRYLDDAAHWFRIPPGEHRIKISHTGIPREGYPYAYWQPDDSAASRAATHWAGDQPKDVSATAGYLSNPAQYDDLLDLKADLLQGDGMYTGTPFNQGEYVRLGDNTQAWFDDPTPGVAPQADGLWVAGYKPIISHPPPVGKPPWIWTPVLDDATGEPVISKVTFQYTEVFL